MNPFVDYRKSSPSDLLSPFAQNIFSAPPPPNSGPQRIPNTDHISPWGHLPGVVTNHGPWYTLNDIPLRCLEDLDLQTTNPQEVALATLNDTRLQIDCKQTSGTGCATAGVNAYVNCGQWNDRIKHIHLCRDQITRINNLNDRGDTIRRIAAVLAHEMMHIWGADEATASSVEVL